MRHLHCPLLRGGGVGFTRRPHKPEIASSSLAPATNKQIYREEAAGLPTRLITLEYVSSILTLATMKLFNPENIKVYRSNPYKVLQTYWWVHEFMNSEPGSEVYNRCVEELAQAKKDHAEWLIECDKIDKGEYKLPKINKDEDNNEACNEASSNVAG